MKNKVLGSLVVLLIESGPNLDMYLKRMLLLFGNLCRHFFPLQKLYCDIYQDMKLSSDRGCIYLPGQFRLFVSRVLTNKEVPLFQVQVCNHLIMVRLGLCLVLSQIVAGEILSCSFMYVCYYSSLRVENVKRNEVEICSKTGPSHHLTEVAT